MSDNSTFDAASSVLGWLSSLLSSWSMMPGTLYRPPAKINAVEAAVRAGNDAKDSKKLGAR